MPWEERCAMDQRATSVSEYVTGLWTMTELCADYQISRKTGYKWIGRHEMHGPGGLHDQSRRPHHSPRATDAEVVETLLALRQNEEIVLPCCDPRSTKRYSRCC